MDEDLGLSPNRGPTMTEMKTKILPVLPLGNGVLLPNMMVPLALETSEAKAAVTAARGSDGVLIVVARVDGTYAPVGCVAKIVDTGLTPGGMDAIVVKGLHRAIIGSGVPGTGDALWVQYEARPDPTRTQPTRSERLVTISPFVARGRVPSATVLAPLARSLVWTGRRIRRRGAPRGR